MDATTMPSMRSMLAKLKQDFPALHIVQGDTFRWSPETQTVYYADTDDTASLLHEIAHAELGHTGYTRDIELLQMEREAWDKALMLAKKYGSTIDDAHIETMLDTYRDWLHARSTCPNCQATGIQSAARQYTCLACNHVWTVNEARSCALRRYSLSK